MSMQDKSRDISSDTPVIFLGGPLNKKVEDWGKQPRGRMAIFHDFMDKKNHVYEFRFLPSPDLGGIDLVIADYTGAEELERA